MVHKEFQVKTSSDAVVVRFTKYKIDGESSNDHFYVIIQGSRQEVQLFGGHGGSWTEPGVTGSSGSATKYKIGFNADTDDFKTTISLEIGYKWYTSGILELGFEADIADSITTRAVGIDDFKMSIDCSRRRMDTTAANKATSPRADEPSEDGGDGSFYCSAEDFSCKTNGNVHICHYDSKRGYQTFCVPEADSEIIRFYPNDYCGPCVGGYGSNIAFH
jgi:hypothetical protein